MSVWVTYFYDVGVIVDGIFATEIEARRAVDGGSFLHVAEVPLPCADVVAFIDRR